MKSNSTSARAVSSPKHQTLYAAALFAGCGGLDLGLSRAGIEIAWANEIDYDSSLSYRKLLGSDIETADIRNCLDAVPSVDLVVGGPPCQSFSLVGRRFQEDPRGQLVFSFVEAVSRANPKAFVMENVRGILSSTVNGQKLIRVLSELFENLGFTVTVVEVNAADFFVPQLRKRVFLVGSRTATPFSLLTPETFQEKIGIRNFHERVGAKEALGDLPVPTGTWGSQKKYRSSPETEFARFIRQENGDQVTLQVPLTMSALDREYVEHIRPGGNYRDIPVNIASPRVLRIMGTGGRTTTYARLHPERPSYTVNTYFNRPNVGSNYHYSQKRLITPREALRLQTFPDNFAPEFSNQRSLFRQIGNAVPPNVGHLIGLSLMNSVFS